ncbi:MAG: FAD-dependent oxidoreductase [Deltaproteobacteria bacterium]|nr:FAD-dependent oxidoreductase [Deltaproteobacteria bacterium]
MNTVEERFDVIVAGGGSAGVAAAVGSARSGARTLLIERYYCLGGASTMRNVLTYCGLYTLDERPKMVVGGVGAEVVGLLKQHNALTGPFRFRGVFVVFDPEAVKIVLDEVCQAAGVTVMHGTMVVAAEREDGVITTVTVADHAGLHRVSAKAFVDCTGEGNLAARAGAGTRYGNDDGVNLGSLGTRFGGIPADLPVSADDIAAAVARLGSDRRLVTKDRGVVARLPHSGDLACYLVSADYDPRDVRSLSAAERDGRRQAWKYLEAIRTIPGCERAYLVATGHEFGTRESRHIESVRQLKWRDVEDSNRFDDCIALGAWGAEWHDRKTYGSTYDYPPERTSYDIPLSCLTSRDTPNLFAAGRVADGDRLAGAAIRVMGTAFATGHAAGVAAAHAANGSPWQAADVRRTLADQGAILDRSAIPRFS